MNELKGTEAISAEFKILGKNKKKDVVYQNLRAELESQARLKAKRINQRFVRMERSGLGINESAYFFAQKELGKEKPRYKETKGYYSRLTDVELKEELLSMEKKLESGTTTKRGLEKVYDNRLTGATEELKKTTGKKISKEQFRNFLNAGGGEVLNAKRRGRKLFDSTQIIEDWQRMTQESRKERLSDSEVVQVFKDFMKKDKIIWSDVRKKLTSEGKKKYRGVKKLK